MKRIQSILIALIVGAPFLAVYLWSMLWLWILRARQQCFYSPVGDEKGGASLRVSFAQCGCKHYEVSAIHKGKRPTVRYHFGRCQDRA